MSQLQIKLKRSNSVASASTKLARKSLSSGRVKAQLAQWWDCDGAIKKYVACSGALLKDNSGNEYHLVWPHSYSAKIDLVWVSENQDIIFQKIKGVKHLALFCSDKKTVLTHWIAGKHPGQKPTRFNVNDSCPGGGGGSPTPDPKCSSIPELPTIDTGEELAEKSVLLFDKCVDVLSLPLL